MIYILGSGYVSQAYAKYFLINSIPHKVVSRKEVLYTNPIALAQFLTSAKPSLLINASGYVGQPNVDACEDHKLACLYSNAILPGFIGEICQSMAIPWIHVSSGCIYDGYKFTRKKNIRPIDIDYNPLLREAPDELYTKRNLLEQFDQEAYTEEDEPNLTFRDKVSSYYSGSKAMGEELLKKSNNAYICRLRMPFNQEAGSRNYLTKLSTYDKLISVSNSITQIDEFVRASYALWINQAPFGVYNITNPGIAEVRTIIPRLITAKLRSQEPEWLTIPEFNNFVRTPRSNCLLDSSKICAIFKLTEVNQAIDKALWEWNQ